MTKEDIRKIYLTNRVKYLDYPDSMADFLAIQDTANQIKGVNRDRLIDIVWEVTNQWRN